MSAKVQFEEPKAAEGAPSAPMVTVPSDVIARRDGKTVVFEIAEGKARMRAVVTGPDRQGRVVVRSGLLGVESLVAHPPETLKDGDAVRVSGDKK
jgi:multidrug efflux pump subunit AcrA (membrane-fusion protein)